MTTTKEQTKPTTKMRFMLLRGMHHEGGSREKGKLYEAGDVVECNVDLMEKFGASKFQKLYSEQQNVDGLDHMTLERLKRVAEEEEVELTINMPREQIIQAIRDAAR